MADDAPTPEQMVPSLLHAVMWACMFGGVDAVIANKPWPVWAGAFALSLISHIVGIKWLQIKPTVGPRFASALERVASNRLYRRAIYAVVATAILASIGFRVHHHYTAQPHLPKQQTESETNSSSQTVTVPPTSQGVQGGNATAAEKELKTKAKAAHKPSQPKQKVKAAEPSQRIPPPVPNTATCADGTIASKPEDCEGNAQAAPRPSATAPGKTNTGHSIDLHILGDNKEPPTAIAGAAAQLVDEYIKTHNGEIPTNEWLNDKLTGAGHRVWANLDCQAHGTGIRIRGTPNVRFGGVDIQQTSCDVGMDVDTKGGTVVVDRDIKVRINGGSSAHIDSVESGPPAAQSQPTYSVTNPVGSIVNQDSPNYGQQTINNGPILWKLDPTSVETLTSAFRNGSHPWCVVSATHDNDSKDLAHQLCKAGGENVECKGPGLKDDLSPLDEAASDEVVHGLECYANSPQNPSLLGVKEALLKVGLSCEYKGATFQTGGVSFCTGGNGTVLVVGTMPPKNK